MNKQVTVKDTKKEAFEMAMRLAFLGVGKFNKDNPKEDLYYCVGYKIENNELFLSDYSDKCTLFPYKYNIRQTIDFAWGWFENNKNPNTHEPDTDGSTAVGWELTTERCGVGSKDWGMFVSIKPVWFVYGK